MADFEMITLHLDASHKTQLAYHVLHPQSFHYTSCIVRSPIKL